MTPRQTTTSKNCLGKGDEFTSPCINKYGANGRQLRRLASTADEKSIHVRAWQFWISSSVNRPAPEPHSRTTCPGGSPVALRDIAPNVASSMICRYTNPALYVGTYSIELQMMRRSCFLQRNVEYRLEHSSDILLNKKFPRPAREHQQQSKTPFRTTEGRHSASGPRDFLNCSKTGATLDIPPHSLFDLRLPAAFCIDRSGLPKPPFHACGNSDEEKCQGIERRIESQIARHSLPQEDHDQSDTAECQVSLKEISGIEGFPNSNAILQNKPLQHHVQCNPRESQVRK